MDVFDLDRGLIGDYERFARSFAKSSDIREQVEESTRVRARQREIHG